MSRSWHIKIICLLMATVSMPGVSTPNLIMPFNTPATAKKTESLSRITQKLSEREIFSAAEKQVLRAVPTFIKNLIKDADPQLIKEFVSLQESFEHIVRKLDTIEEDTSKTSRDTQTVKRLIGILLDIAKEVQPTATRAVGDIIFNLSVTIKDKILEVLELLELLSDLNESFSETLESLIDIVIADINIDFAGTFTMLNALESKLDQLTTNTNCSITASCDFSGTYTAIAALQNTINIDFAGTWTSIAALQNTVNVDFAGTFTMLDALESKLDILTSTTTCRACDLSGTYTAIAALQNTINVDFAGTWTSIAALQNTVNVDFAGTWTVLAAIQNLINVDFAGTYTAIAALQNTVNVDFAGTWTMIEALELCEPVCLTQANFASGTFTSATPGISYRLAEDVTGNFEMSAANVTLDLNEHVLGGTVIISTFAQRATIQNGKIIPPAPADAGQASTPAVFLISSDSQLLDCYIICTNSESNLPGRPAVENAGISTLIQNCYIQGGNGADGTSANAGGTAIRNGSFGAGSGIGLRILGCRVIGGNAGTTTGGDAAAGGKGILLEGGSFQVVIRDCQITSGNGGNGSGGTNSGGNAERALDMQQATMTDVLNCVFEGGTGGNAILASTGNGGGGSSCVTMSNAQDIVIDNCLIVTGSGGTVDSGVGGSGGTGIVPFGGNRIAVSNCVITAGQGGDALLTGTGGDGGNGILQFFSTPNNYSFDACIVSAANGGAGGKGGNGGRGYAIGSMVSTMILNTIIKETGVGGASTSPGIAGGNGGDGIFIDTGASFTGVGNTIIMSTGSAGASGDGGPAGTGGQAINDTGSNSAIYNNFASNIANSTAYTLGASAAIDQPNGTAFLDLLTTSTAHGYLNVHKP